MLHSSQGSPASEFIQEMVKVLLYIVLIGVIFLELRQNVIPFGSVVYHVADAEGNTLGHLEVAGVYIEKYSPGGSLLKTTPSAYCSSVINALHCFLLEH